MRYGIALGLVASAAAFLLIIVVLRMNSPRFHPSPRYPSTAGLVHWANPLGAPACRQPVGYGDRMTHAGPPTCPHCIRMGVAGRVIANPAVFFGGKD